MHAPKAARGLHYLCAAAAADAADALAQLHAHKVSARARHGDSFSFLFHESNAAFSDVDPDIIKQSHEENNYFCIEICNFSEVLSQSDFVCPV
jgi:hypothetical protein